MAELQDAHDDGVTYEDLAQLEREFDQVDVEILRQQYHLTKDLYVRRKQVISKLPGFWPLVLESAPPEIDRYIQPSDSEIFAKCLLDIQVDRFELAPTTSSSGSGGDPRSFSIRFEFAENEWFSDRTVEKKFWWRRAQDGWSGLVSEPVRIDWAKGKDPTKGLMEGALKLWEARKGAGGDMRKRDLPEFDHMSKLTETWNGDNTSFFTWFAFVSGRRWVSAQESEAAVAAQAAQQGRVANGTAKEEENAACTMQVPEEEQLEAQVEAHEDGDGLATVFAEDLWPGAIKYLTQAQEDAETSDQDFESDEDDEVEEEEEEGVSGPDLRELMAATKTGMGEGGDDDDDDDDEGRDRKRRRQD